MAEIGVRFPVAPLLLIFHLGVVAHLGEHPACTRKRPVRIRSTPLSLLRPSQRGACLVCRRWRVQFSRAARRKHGIVGTRSSEHRPRVGPRSSKPSMRVRFPLLAPKFCGGSSVVESERAKLGTGVRFSLTALSVWFVFSSRISGEEWGLQNRVSGFDSRPALRRKESNCPRRPAEGSPSSKRRCAGSTPAEGSRSSLPCHVPIFARWPRQPDSHSGNAGSNPAGDTGPTRRPVVFFGVPRLGDRACQFNVTALLCSLCPGGRASGYELDWRGSTPRREANPSAPRSHARRPAPVLVARDTSVRSLSPRFDSWQGRRREGRSHPGFIPPALQVQFLLLQFRGASRRAAALIRLSVEVRILPSRSRLLGVAQSGRAPVPGTGDWRFESSHPDRLSSSFSGCGSIWSEHRFGEPGTGGSNPSTQTCEHLIGAGRYGDLSSLIRSSFRVRLPVAPPVQGSFSGESTGVTSRIR